MVHKLRYRSRGSFDRELGRVDGPFGVQRVGKETEGSVDSSEVRKRAKGMRVLRIWVFERWWQCKEDSDMRAVPRRGCGSSYYSTRARIYGLGDGSCIRR